MMKLPKKLEDKLEKRSLNQSLRKLGTQQSGVDFSSNDYLGLSQSQTVFKNTQNYLKEHAIFQNGATGSRLISGNHSLYQTTERFLCQFHESESALIFNSGYDANVGFFSSVPQRGDVILYDEYAHASIRDGIQMSNAKSYKFKHNDLSDLERQLERSREVFDEIYVVTESVFSMDGDTPDLQRMSSLVNSKNAYLIVDEAHAIGVFGENGSGEIQRLNLQQDVFARIITFGKALGCHGAAILGSSILKEYLVNFARSLIYTTGLSPHSLATILSAYNFLIASSKNEKSPQKQLAQNIIFFQQEIKRLELQNRFISSTSAIHSCVISGNESVKLIANQLQEKGFNVKPILSPTVPENQERIRFCLHSYNSPKEITNVLETLRIFVMS
jgi:8-amino-7-oxononanoate synthase